MLINLFNFRVTVILCSTLLLCQCSPAVNSPEPIKVTPGKASSPYKLPSADYLARANSQYGAARQNSLLLAAGRMISEGQWRQGMAILTQTLDLTVLQQSEKTLLLAKVDLLQDKPQQALTKLSHVEGVKQLNQYNQIEFHELLAQSYLSAGNQIQSILERIKLQTLLPDNKSQVKNQRNLWLALINLPQPELMTLVTETNESSPLQGWANLAIVAQKYRNNGKSLLAALDQWQSHYSTHPANQMLPNPLDSIADKMITQPKKIALLLPVTGPLSGPGNAIKEGFMAASKANQNKVIEIKTYDTNNGDISRIYQQAITEGAEYVVGPLPKNQVAIVAKIDHLVPTLLLNDTDKLTQNNSYSFGLSPTSEAIQVARKARGKGYSRVLIIAPWNDWGNEVTKAFTRQWQMKGGQVADTLLYTAKEDMNKKMRDFLQITESQKRERQIKELLGQNIQAAASRRQDFDMIFLLAYPSKARQIMPLLNYYYAADIPVYATSSVYAGHANALKDKDLDGIIFCDIPWVFSHQMGTRNWPEQFNSYNRLYALGMDSYALATQLNQLIVFPADGVMEKGALYLKSSQQVARILEWGQFRQGLAHSLGQTA